MQVYANPFKNNTDIGIAIQSSSFAMSYSGSSECILMRRPYAHTSELISLSADPSVKMSIVHS